ncbi:DUF3383 domain-containing protein [Pseudodesulfovibrio pelocollis]|uniref:DUF3383 domain-containing protein n=1 Tax=Pseudodesulfovibrio pelocollis TaxID=3051432 RepID=UPI00255AAB23|nr:DUF3383 domain-containing protein [Pseudodesulfovibrio sp. SB368]
MTTGLSVNRVVNVAVNLQPLAVPRRSFGVLCIAGDTPVIDGVERIRAYTSIDAVGDDFGSTDPEYLTAQLYFSQSPRPRVLAIGRYISTATVAILRGGSAETDLDAWTAIADGAMDIEVEGVETSLTGLDFSGATTMPGVAAIISAALAGAGSEGAACAWDGSRFVITTVATGATVFMGYATAPASGTDISAMTGLTSALAYAPVPGFDAETPAECAAALADVSGEWYGLMFAAALTVDQHVAVAAFIEATGKSRVYGVTDTDPRCLSATYTADIGSRLKALDYDRSFVLYCAGNAYAVASFFGRAFSVNFSANRSTITLKFKQLPGVVAETLTETQATALAAKRVNVFVYYDNDTAIIQEGTMASGAFFDEVHGLDWLQNAVQTECWNLLYQSKTKIPQTESGISQIKARISSVFAEAVANGLVAPGTWNADGFGQLEQGDYLPTGYYIYSTPLVDQAQSEREERKAPPIQCAVKLAGAVHFVDVQIDVNR